jgi:glucose-6-phosphate 1-dehydrogenase
MPSGGNALAFELSGDGEIDLALVTKRPGPTDEVAAAAARLPLGQSFHTPSLPAYSRLIHDVLLGDRSLFTRPDGLRHVWEVAGGLLENKPPPLIYPKGSWGPPEATELAGPQGWVLGQ